MRESANQAPDSFLVVPAFDRCTGFRGRPPARDRGRCRAGRGRARRRCRRRFCAPAASARLPDLEHFDAMRSAIERCGRVSPCGRNRETLGRRKSAFALRARWSKTWFDASMSAKPNGFEIDLDNERLARTCGTPPRLTRVERSSVSSACRACPAARPSRAKSPAARFRRGRTEKSGTVVEHLACAACQRDLDRAFCRVPEASEKA